MDLKHINANLKSHIHHLKIQFFENSHNIQNKNTFHAILLQRLKKTHIHFSLKPSQPFQNTLPNLKFEKNSRWKPSL